MQKLQIALTCYRFIALPSVIITLIASGFIWGSGTPLYLIPALWTKVSTTAVLLLLVYFYKSSQFFFFNNLGYSNAAIYMTMIGFDFFITGLSFSGIIFLLP